MRLTTKRKQILDLLKNTKAPMSATTVSKCLPDVDLVTIYRNLDLFTQEGLVKRLQFDDEALYEFQETPHHHAICENCQKMIHFSVPEKQLKKLIVLEDFDINSIDITVKGNCVHEAS